MNRNSKFKRRNVLTCVLIALYFFQTAWAQSTEGLRVQVVEGSGAQNIVEQIPATPLSVRVVDRNNRPVRGATVVFTSPSAGPSGDFANGQNVLSTLTDEEGIALAPQYRPNDVLGSYEIRVRADYLGQNASNSIRQTNVAQKKSLGKIIAIMAVAGAAGAAGAALAARKGAGGAASPSTSPTPVPGGGPTITFGGSSVAGPPQ